jgi:hypothetical protein
VRLRPLSLALVLGFVAVRAQAAVVALEVGQECTSVDRPQLARLLRVEQRQVGSELARAKVTVSCAGEVVTLSVARRDEPEARERTFAAADVTGEIGARVLSLAAIELLKQERVEVAEAPRAAAAALPPPSPPSPPPPPREPKPSVRLMLAGGAQSFAWQKPLLGGGLAVDYLRLSGLGLRLAFDVAVANHDYDSGSARVQLTTLSAQGGYLTLRDTWMARAFVGYRLGAARISGEMAPGVLAPVGTVAGACGGPLLSGGLGLRSGGWIAELGAEVGLVSFPLEGTVEAHEPIRLDRYWLGLSLNVGALL